MMVSQYNVHQALRKIGMQQMPNRGLGRKGEGGQNKGGQVNLTEKLTKSHFMSARCIIFLMREVREE